MSRRSTIRTYKHIPGGARPTPAPQGSQGGYYNQLSPLTSQLNTGGSQGATYNYAYGGFLPRPSEDFTEGAFSPFSPILPVPVDSPASPDTPRAAPRRYQYQPGYNLPVGQPGSEGGLKLVDFQTLRTLGDLYSIARACIELRKNEIRGLSWDIMPTKDAAKAMRGSDKKMRDFGQRRAEAMKFFNHPADYDTWSRWLGALLEDVFVIDAMSMVLMPKWGAGTRKGLLGSDLDCLRLVDGSTIRPLIDMHGYPPRPPAPAFQQYLYGVPRSDFMTMMTQRDVDEYKGLEAGPPLTDMQMIYRPFDPRNWTPYGFTPIEQAIIPVMSGLQKQGYQLDFFREGTVPAVYISPGGDLTPNQRRELQDALNAIAGDVAYKHKIIVLPNDSKVMPQKPTEIADQFDEIVMNQVCMAFNVMPMELGIMPKVSTTASPGAANQMGKESQATQERKATKPMLEFLASIFNTILHDVCQQDDMRFTFEGLEEDEDEATQTGMLIQQIGGGLRSIDEAREELGLQPWGLPETQDPGWATATGFIPLGQMAQNGQAAPGQQPNAQSPAGAQPTPPGQAPGAAAKPTGTAATAAPAKKTTAKKTTPAKKPSGGSAGGTPAHAASQASDVESGKGNAKTGSKSDDPDLVKLQKPKVDHHARREALLVAIESKTTNHLKNIVNRYRTSQIAAPEATDTAVDALTTGYDAVMDQASQDAVTDGNADQTMDQSGHAKLLGEQQRVWLVNLLKEVALGYAINLISNRLATYSASLSKAYNQAYGQTVQAGDVDGKSYAITWHLGPTEHCPLCLARSGKKYTFDTLPGWPGDGGFGQLCYGGQNCGCYLTYAENGQTLASGGNAQRDGAVPYYQQQLATIQQRRQDVLSGRQDALDAMPADARARAMTRDQIAQQLAAAENAAIQSTGGYGGISVEWMDVSAARIAELVPDAMKARAVDSELAALARHYRKGREIASWKPRHIDSQTIMSIDEDVTKGLTIEQAIEVAKQQVRRVNLDGEIVGVNVPDPDNANYPVSQGGGGRVFPAHDVNGIEVGDGRVPQPEVPGGTPTDSTGGRTSSWAPAEGTSSGETFSDRSQASHPEGDEDDEYPQTRGIPSSQGGGPAGGAPSQASIGSLQPPTAGAPGGARKGGKLDAVKQLMSKNFPPKAYAWADDATWTGPVNIPIDQIDWDASKTWATAHEEGKVEKFKADIQAGNPPHPAIAVKQPGDPKYKLVDGHHRATAYKQLNQATAPAYVGQVTDADDRWEETHSFQTHQGSSSANKAATPIAAGIAVVAADSGRILMLQRAQDDSDPAAGLWEFPGGCAEPSDAGSVDTAGREWSEETGCQLPDGRMIGSYTSPDGVYETFVYQVPSEGTVPIHTDRDQVVNPDDPDGDNIEALAWWDPDHLAGNPAVRPQVLTGAHQLRGLLSS